MAAGTEDLHQDITAYGDESFRDEELVYVLSTVLVPAARADVLRHDLRRMAGRAGRVHWHDRSASDRVSLAADLADLAVDSFSWSVVVPGVKQQERGRRLLLGEAMFHLASASASALVLETRHAERNRHDVEAIDGFRRAGLMPASFVVAHGRPLEEQLLWLADIVAGCVGEARSGRPSALNRLGDRAVVFEVPYR